ncbi:hypothetical protein [Microcoleus sp. Pol17_C1]
MSLGLLDGWHGWHCLNRTTGTAARLHGRTRTSGTAGTCSAGKVG